MSIIFLCAGCAEMNLTSPLSSDSDNADTVSENQEAVSAFVSMEDEALLSYEVPKSSPHILIDQHGYASDSTKQAFFFGSNLPTAFKVIDADSKSVVYQGIIESRGYSDVYEANIASGDFSSVTEKGTYYIEANLLGCSYSFQIGGNLYQDLFCQACKTYYYNRCGMTLTEEFAGSNAHNACHTEKSVLRDDMTVELDVSGGWHQDSTGSKEISNAATSLATILLAYEVFPNAFDDDFGIPESQNGIPDILDEAKYEIDWLLKMQNQETGAVYSAVTVATAENKSSVSYVETPTIDSTRAFAFVLAKFSYVFQEYDKEYATLCLKAADRAWKYAELNEEEDSPWKMAAAAEIYRASGLKDCERYLREYFLAGGYKEERDTITFLGCVTYLSTTQPVDTAICADIIKVIMKNAELISQESRQAPFLVPFEKEQTNNSELLSKMITMTLVDHIISNHEYDMIIENYLHYFLGRNPMSITYLDNVGTYSYINVHESLGLMKKFDEDSKLIFLLAKVISQDGFIE